MNADNLSFTISDAVNNLGLKGTYLVFKNLENRAFDNNFENLKSKILESFVNHLSKDFIKANKILEGFRILHKKVDRSNRKHISSPENIILYIIRYGTIPHINLIVDIYNLISAKYLLALGAHDISFITGNIHLRITEGSENFIPLGMQSPKLISPGEYSYIDDDNDIICRMEVRQVEKTKVVLNTKECFYIIQGNEKTANDYIEKVSDELIQTTKKFCGGEERILYRSNG